MARNSGMKPGVRKVVPTPKSIYGVTSKKPNPDDVPFRHPPGSMARARRLKGTPL